MYRIYYTGKYVTSIFSLPAGLTYGCVFAKLSGFTPNCNNGVIENETC